MDEDEEVLLPVTRGRRCLEWVDGRPSLAAFNRMDKWRAAVACVWMMKSILLHALSAILICVNYVLKRISPTPSAKENVSVMRVFGRHKPDDMRLPATTDFFALHTRWTTTEELLDDHWMIYTMSGRNATFVRMPEGEEEYQARQSSFLYIDQHSLAQYVAVMPVEEMISMGRRVGQPKHSVLLISNSGRAGTTLLAQLLQVQGMTVSFSEPDILFALGVVIQDAIWGKTKSAYVPLLQSVMNILCKNQKEGVSYVFKSRCFSNALLPIVKQSVPYVRQMFLYRAHTNAGCRSMVRSFMTRLLLSALYDWKTVGVGLTDRLWISGSSVEKIALRAVKPPSLWEYGAVVYAVQYAYLLDSHAADDSVLKMSYEELMEDTTAALTSIYSLMSWPTTSIPASLSCLAKDSQHRSPLSRELLRTQHAPVLPVTEERAEEMAFILRLPNDFFKPDFVFDHRDHLRSKLQ